MRISAIKSNIYFKGVSINPAYRQDDKDKQTTVDTLKMINQIQKNLKNAKTPRDLYKIWGDDPIPYIRQDYEVCEEKHSSDYLKNIAEGIKLKEDKVKEEDVLIKQMTEDNKRAKEDIINVKETIRIVDEVKKQKGIDLSSMNFAPLRKDEGFNKLAGYEKEKEILYTHFISQILKAKNGEEAKVPGAVLFFGPQGNGKTTFATAFAQEIGCEKPIRILLDTIFVSDESKYIERLEKACEKAKEKYQKTGDVQVILLDEIDIIANGDSESQKKLKEILENAYKKYHAVIFGTTNHPLDIALPITGEDSVFPYIVSVDPPSKEEKKEILKFYLDGRCDKKLSEEDYNKIVKRMEQKEKETNSKYSVAQIKREICGINKGKRIAYNMVLENIDNPKCYPNITQSKLNEYKESVKKIMNDKVEE